MTEPHRVGPVGDIVRRNIRQLRKQQYLNQADLSSKLLAAGHQFLPTSVSRVESGGRRLDADDLVAFATALGVTAARLFEPPTDCDSCHGTPPPGFTCNACGDTS